MDLVSLTHAYVSSFDKKDIDGLSNLMSDEFVLSDGVVNGLAPKKEVLLYISQMMEANVKRFGFEVVDILRGSGFTILEFKLYLDNTIFHGVDLIQWDNGLMTSMKAFLNDVEV